MGGAKMIPSPLPINSPDQIIAILADSLSMAKGLPGILGAIFVGIIALALALLIIAKYYADKGAREKEAYETDMKVRQIQAINLTRMQKDAASSLLDNMDLSYRQDYDYYVQKIGEGKFDAVYVKINPKFYTELSTFIYDQSIPPEQRAARVILIVKPTL